MKPGVIAPFRSGAAANPATAAEACFGEAPLPWFHKLHCPARAIWHASFAPCPTSQSATSTRRGRARRQMVGLFPPSDIFGTHSRARPEF